MNLPQLTRPEALKLIAPFNRQEKVIFLGIRGYFKNSMGVKDANDIGIYDDAIFIISPTYYGGFNGNTDPSKMGVGVASLKSNQVVLFSKDLHGVSHSPVDVVARMRSFKINNPAYPRTYWAFRQASNVTVIRNGKEEVDNPAARLWVDLHCGGQWTTSSLACQTIIKDQWPEFKTQGYGLMDLYNQSKVPYILIDQS